MIKLISTRIIYGFSLKNKTQNFFDLAPVYPDFGEKNFDIYNSQRKTINVVDAYMKFEGKDRAKRALVRHRIYLPHYDKYKRYSGGRNLVVQKDTKLILGIDSDYDDFIRQFKRDKFTDKNAKSQFKQTLLKLIYKFKCKSQSQLIRLFRISIANSKKKSLLDKLRGSVIQEAVLKAAQIMKNYDSINPEELVKLDNQQQQFQNTLKQLDKKIENIQKSLLYDKNGVPKVLSNYDPKYGWKQTREVEIDFDTDLNFNDDNKKIVTFSSVPEPGKEHDWSIRTRINRLYFLRRLQYLSKDKSSTQFKNTQFEQDLPLNIRQKQNIMNQIAFKYKQQELLQPPDLNQIYNQIDNLIDKVVIKISPGKQNSQGKKPQIEEELLPKQNYLWETISAQQILCSTLYDNYATTNLVLTEEKLKQVSPSADTELSLSRLPINLFRHSQLDCIGVFNQFRTKLSKDLLCEQQTDFQPYFDTFTLQQAQHRYKKIQRQFVQRKVSSKAHAKRKTALATAIVKKGTGVVKINGKLIQDYFGDTYYRVQTLKPLVFTDSSGLYDVNFDVLGSGLKGQAECMAYALARALMKINPQHKRILACFGLVGFDFRRKEAKKTNLYSARVRPPYVRR